MMTFAFVETPNLHNNVIGNGSESAPAHLYYVFKIIFSLNYIIIRIIRNFFPLENEVKIIHNSIACDS